MLFTLDPPQEFIPATTDPTPVVDFDQDHPFLQVSFPINRGSFFPGTTFFIFFYHNAACLFRTLKRLQENG